jgi:uncharacterized protein (TIGR03435 family)
VFVSAGGGVCGEVAFVFWTRIWIAIVGCVAASGQVEEKLTFEVASVRPSPPVPPNGGVDFGPPRGGPGTPDPDRISWSYATLKSILMTAYDVKAYQINGPDWLGTGRYDIAAKVSEGATKAQVTSMWQNLLAERFGVTLHHESKEFRVEELVISNGGHKLTEVEEDPSAVMTDAPPKLDNGKLSGPGLVTRVSVDSHGAHAISVAKAQPLSKLLEMLGNQLGRPVLDKTGLTGRYDFTIDFTWSMAGIPPPPLLAPPGPEPVAVSTEASEPGTGLVAAVQKQLGLRLVGGKAKLDVLVIDKAEKVPTEN